MLTSGTYSFQNTATTDVIIQDAYERCGVVGSELTGLQVDSAVRSLNFMLSDWTNRGLNLSTIETGIITLVPGQPTYTLPSNLTRVEEVTGESTQRFLNGASSSNAGGTASNAFDGSPLTACTQTSPNGSISYQYSQPYPTILYVGILSLTKSTYNIVCESSYSGDEDSWVEVGSFGERSFMAASPASPVLGFQPQTLWCYLTTPIKCSYIRIRETGGNTLNISEVYFNSDSLFYIGTQYMTAISRSEYAAIPNKLYQAAVSSYVFQPFMVPTLTLWPTPNTTYPLLKFNYASYYQDVNKLTENGPLPQKFYEAFCAGLASRIAQKFFPDKYQLLSMAAAEAYGNAAKFDDENVPLRLQPNWYTGS